MTTRQLQLIFPEKKSRKKKTKLLRYVIDHGPLLSRGILWEVCKWRILAIGCCVAWYFNLSHVNDYSHSSNVRALTNISTKNKKKIAAPNVNTTWTFKKISRITTLSSQIIRRYKDVTSLILYYCIIWGQKAVAVLSFLCPS